jgi:hypothetical protein
MPETDVRAGYELAPETKARLAELFAGQTCCRCGEPATRLAGDRFSCAAHYLRRLSQRAGRPKVYRCAVAMGGER